MKYLGVNLISYIQDLHGEDNSSPVKYTKEEWRRWRNRACSGTETPIMSRSCFLTSSIKLIQSQFKKRSLKVIWCIRKTTNSILYIEKQKSQKSQYKIEVTVITATQCQWRYKWTNGTEKRSHEWVHRNMVIWVLKRRHGKVASAHSWMKDINLKSYTWYSYQLHDALEKEKP